MNLHERHKIVQQKIAESAARANRRIADVSLVAVSKTVTATEIAALRALGVTEFGENRVQSLLQKTEVIADINWHFIGHLQSNKVKYIIDKITLIHSLDRLSLAEELQKRAEEKRLCVKALVQVNVSGEKSKYGLSPHEVVDFCDALNHYKGLEIVGLMTMAPYVENPEEVRYVFRGLREIREKIVSRDMPHLKMTHLSMGMSNDYHIAVEEGATLVRVGTALFGKRR